ncbi:MAG TPA: CoA transferase [Acidimicrobiia bacterium]|nr:CoA transferase [Acidimicrobiia bacterium]
MRLGDVANADAVANGKPLDGVRVLALEQMQALPYATQLLSRLGAEVVKIEPPTGESGRGSLPGMLDPYGRLVGATFLRNNLSKRSVAVDLKHPAGRDLVLRLAPRFDVVAENFKPGTADRLGLGYRDFAAVHPTVVYVSVSGAGNLVESPYAEWPAYASMAEAVAGIYEYTRPEGHRPRANPVGALGDIASALFAVIGTLAALRHRDTHGIGQHVDISMFDATAAMTDIVMNLGSLGLEHLLDNKAMVLDTFQATDGFFVLQLVREHQFERLAHLVGHAEWLDDPRFATREQWGEHVEDVLRPAIEQWAHGFTKLEAAHALSDAGIAASPCQSSAEVRVDPHLRARNMLVEMERTDGVAQPVLVPGNPVKMSAVAEGPESRVPWVGEHTFAVLGEELGLDDEELRRLAREGAIVGLPDDADRARA